MSTQKKKILYGAGEMGKRAYDFYTEENPDAVFCFADSVKGGTYFCGKPVISFNDFVEIYKGYDIILCIFDLFDLLHDFRKAGIYDFEVWQDCFTVSEHERNLESFEFLRSLDTQDDRKKILYGAGYYGKKALDYYGVTQVFAFADKNKAGTMYFDKPVLNPIDLAALSQKYEIVICVFEYESVSEYLNSFGVTDYRLFIMLSDVRANRPGFDYTARDTIYDPKVIRDMEKLDFIEYPELIHEYYSKYLAAARRVPGLSRSIVMTPRYIEENLLYGYFDEMLNYADRTYKYYEAPAVGHGYSFFDDSIALKWHNLIETGHFFRDCIARQYSDYLCFLVGPYFHYSRSFYDDKMFDKCKKSLGKNLTVFPVHSNKYESLSYDENEFVATAFNEAKKFDSISVCVYHNDYYDKTVQMFKAGGAKIVSAGFISDTSFIKRLKTIMLLSEAVLTNGLGSHVFHALSVNKPVKIIPQEFSIKITTNKLDLFNAAYGERKLLLQSMLEVDDYRITQEQLDICEPYIGFSKVRTKKEMGAIFDISKRIVQNCDYKRQKYLDSIRQIYRDLQKAVTDEEKLQLRLMKEALPMNYDEFICSSCVDR